VASFYLGKTRVAFFTMGQAKLLLGANPENIILPLLASKCKVVVPDYKQ
jgi:hypothetical protein